MLHETVIKHAGFVDFKNNEIFQALKSHNNVNSFKSDLHYLKSRVYLMFEIPCRTFFYVLFLKFASCFSDLAR